MEMMMLLADWGWFLAYAAGVATGYLAFFRDDHEEDLWDKKVALHRPFHHHS